MIADYAWGQSFKSSLEDAAKSAPNIKFNIQVAPVPTTNFTPYLRAFGDVSLIVATGHPPGAPLVLAQAGAAGPEGAGGGCGRAVVAHCEEHAASSAFGRYSDFKCMATASKEYKNLAKRYLRTFPQNEFMEDDALAGYAYVKIVAEAISKVGTNSAEDRRLRPRAHVQHPRVRVAAQVDAVGRDDRGATAVRHPDQGRTARGAG